MMQNNTARATAPRETSDAELKQVGELTAAEMRQAGGGTKLPDLLVSSYQHSGSGGGTLPGSGGSGLSFFRIKQRA